MLQAGGAEGAAGGGKLSEVRSHVQDRITVTHPRSAITEAAGGESCTPFRVVRGGQVRCLQTSQATRVHYIWLLHGSM